MAPVAHIAVPTVVHDEVVVYRWKAEDEVEIEADRKWHGKNDVGSIGSSDEAAR